MIKKINLKNVASYCETPAILETDKRINLIYGLNGTGKTTFSKYLQDKDNVCFSDCSITGLNNEKVLVYNQKFILDNFYQDTQKGIFSLKSENKEAKLKIDKATETIKILSSQIKNDVLKTGYQFDLEKKQKDIENLQLLSEEKIWEINTKYWGEDRSFNFCLERKMGSKAVLFKYISEIHKPSAKLEKSVGDLKKEIEATQSENAKTYDESLIKKINYNFSEIEKHEIFKEVIIGNENSQVAKLINKLDNSDWVKKGKGFIGEPEENNETCPFCQQRTISKNLYKEINNYFDESYQNKIKDLENLNSEYLAERQNVENIENNLFDVVFIKAKETEFKLLTKNLMNKLNSNCLKISNKIKSPNLVVALGSSILEQEAINSFLDTIIGEIRIHNDKVINKQNTKNQIVKDFWDIMRWDYDQTIENYKAQKEKFEKEKLGISTKISELNKNIEEQRATIKDAQKEMINVQDAIDAINSELIYFGLDGFSIVPAGEESYKLKRPNEDVTKFETLSEGEKTVISFLYFLELCKGKENNDEVATEKIVVIDDPISSLSHMYVFNVAQLIRKNFFNEDYEQVFILTHNLYLFHELIKYTEKNKKNDREKLFRIIKNQKKESAILEMSNDEIMNDYQSYWKIIREHDQQNSTNSSLANSMRNILEYFFGFIDNEKYEKAIEKLSDNKYSYFLRYINRESHFDRVNISDTKEIEPLIFKDAFEKIFEDSGHIEHYNKMMEKE